MKTVSLISLLSGMLLASCSETRIPTTTEIVVIHDITDSLVSKPNADEIIPLFGLDMNKSNAADFRLVTISDVSYNKVESISLEPITASKWLSSDFRRGKAIKEFEKKITGILMDATHDNTGKEYSSVYKPIATELNRLSKSKAENKILIVYSDLMEHEKEMSFYDKRELGLLKTQPEQIKKYFDLQLPLGCLDGITVYFLYQPTNAEKDNQYNTVSNFYKNLLQEKGATVIIAANLTK